MGYDNEGKHDGNGIKMVPESDLIAVKLGKDTAKTAHDTAITDLNTQITETAERHKGELATATSTAATHQESAANLKLELAGLSDVKTSLESTQTKLTEITTEAEAAKNSLAERDITLLDTRKKVLIASGVEESKLVEIKTLGELEDIEKAINILGGAKPNGDGKKITVPFFGSTGGSGSGKGDGTSGASKVLAGIASGDHIRKT